MTNKADVVVGIQWGDEGKGRIVDLFAERYDIVARFGGGDNAGHTIQVGDVKIALRIVPSGALQKHTELFIGGGVVAGLAGLVAEIDALQHVGVDPARIKISDRAQIVFPYHPMQDRASEAARGEQKIGTTGRGIGPAYVDRAGRNGITMGDLARGTYLEKLRLNLEQRAELIRADGSMDASQILEQTALLAARITPHVVDGVDYVHGALEGGRAVLIEGAQGSLLDVTYGSYPFVTSSHTIAGGACTGLGIGPGAIDRVIGIAKAYCTRVGGGPFPSELLGERGDALRVAGHEFGTVTGRPRRCGWFDAVAARYAARLNGLTSLVITKLDVLSGIERLGVVTAYRDGGKPAGFEAIGSAQFETEVEELDGWSEPIAHVRRIADLPAAARRYIARLEAAVGVPVEVVSVGPERAQLAR